MFGDQRHQKPIGYWGCRLTGLESTHKQRTPNTGEQGNSKSRGAYFALTGRKGHTAQFQFFWGTASIFSPKKLLFSQVETVSFSTPFFFFFQIYIHQRSVNEVVCAWKHFFKFSWHYFHIFRCEQTKISLKSSGKLLPKIFMQLTWSHALESRSTMAASMNTGQVRELFEKFPVFCHLIKITSGVMFANYLSFCTNVAYRMCVIYLIKRYVNCVPPMWAIIRAFPQDRWCVVDLLSSAICQLLMISCHSGGWDTCCQWFSINWFTHCFSTLRSMTGQGFRFKVVIFSLAPLTRGGEFYWSKKFITETKRVATPVWNEIVSWCYLQSNVQFGHDKEKNSSMKPQIIGHCSI